MSCETKLRIAGDPVTYGELDDNAVTADRISIEALSGAQINASNIVVGRIHLSPHLEEGLLRTAVVALEEIAKSAEGSEAARALAALHEMHNLVVTYREDQ